MARRLIKRTTAPVNRIEFILQDAHKILSKDNSMYSVHEFNITLAELVVKECADIARREILMFNNSVPYNGKVLIEEAIYKHFNMVDESDA
jgi:hypothetical protein